MKIGEATHHRGSTTRAGDAVTRVIGLETSRHVDTVEMEVGVKESRKAGEGCPPPPVIGTLPRGGWARPSLAAR